MTTDREKAERTEKAKRAEAMTNRALIALVGEMLEQDASLGIVDQLLDANAGAREVVDLAQTNPDLFNDPISAWIPWSVAVGMYARFLIEFQRRTGLDVMGYLRGE